LIKLKESSPCADCGNYYPYYMMDFDHLRDKKKGLAAMSLYGWGTILKEIEKCEVVCANCHRIRTFKRKENH
jgi:hypothetical protein